MQKQSTLIAALSGVLLYTASNAQRKIQTDICENMLPRIAVAVIVVLFIIASYLILTGFRERTDVYLIDFSVSESGDEITLSVGVSSSMGYIRGYKDEGGGVKHHKQICYNLLTVSKRHPLAALWFNIDCIFPLYFLHQ